MIDGYKIAAVCTSRIYEDYIISYIGEFNRVLIDNGWRVFVYTVNSDLYYKTRSEKGEEAVFDLIDYERIEAVIVFKNSLNDASIRESIVSKAREHGVQIIMIDDDSMPDCINIMFDYKNGFKSIVRHLFDDHGVRDIHMIAGIKGSEASEERIDAVRELATERGAAFDDSRISYGDFWSEPAERACEELIAHGKLPEALICANDTMAIAACATLRKHGIKVPDDILVTGFDGIEAAKYTYPRISTAKCDFEKLGREIADVLLGDDKTARNIYIMPTLVKSESCGCGVSTADDVAKVITSYSTMFEHYRNDERRLVPISSMVQDCDSLDEVERELDEKVFSNLVCVLKKECTDPTYDPLTVNTDTSYGRDMVVLLDSGVSYIGKDRSMDISRIIPQLGEVLEAGIPLIFTSIHYNDIPLGYACFVYSSPSRGDYNKIAQSSGYLSSAIGGYRSMRYQKRLREWIEEVYKYDELTGLYTRKSFCREYDRMIEEDGCTEMTFVLCDLDGLKYINDNYGHSEGDMAIRVVAKALELACEGGICSKHGGDEILGAVPRIMDKDTVKAKIESFIDDYNEASCKPYRVSSSIGVCTASGGDLSFSKLFAEVDDLMYVDKVRKKTARSSDIGIK